MKFDEFKLSLKNEEAPLSLDGCLLALWLDAKGRWDEAHDIVQNTGGIEGDLIHAYLHRKEGDIANASYWYARAKNKLPDMPIADEWEQIVRNLLAR